MFQQHGYHFLKGFFIPVYIPTWLSKCNAFSVTRRLVFHITSPSASLAHNADILLPITFVLFFSIPIPLYTLFLNPKQLLQLPHGILRILYSMAHRPRILRNLIVVATLLSVIPEKMHGRVIYAANVLFGGYMFQTVGFIPAGGKGVKGDLAADGEAEWSKCWLA